MKYNTKQYRVRHYSSTWITLLISEQAHMCTCSSRCLSQLFHNFNCCVTARIYWHIYSRFHFMIPTGFFSCWGFCKWERECCTLWLTGDSDFMCEPCDFPCFLQGHPGIAVTLLPISIYKDCNAPRSPQQNPRCLLAQIDIVHWTQI